MAIILQQRSISLPCLYPLGPRSPEVWCGSLQRGSKAQEYVTASQGCSTPYSDPPPRLHRSLPDSTRAGLGKTAVPGRPAKLELRHRAQFGWLLRQMPMSSRCDLDPWALPPARQEILQVTLSVSCLARQCPGSLLLAILTAARVHMSRERITSISYLDENRQ